MIYHRSPGLYSLIGLDRERKWVTLMTALVSLFFVAFTQSPSALALGIAHYPVDDYSPKHVLNVDDDAEDNRELAAIEAEAAKYTFPAPAHYPNSNFVMRINKSITLNHVHVEHYNVPAPTGVPSDEGRLIWDSKSTVPGYQFLDGIILYAASQSKNIDAISEGSPQAVKEIPLPQECKVIYQITGNGNWDGADRLEVTLPCRNGKYKMAFSALVRAVRIDLKTIDITLEKI